MRSTAVHLESSSRLQRAPWSLLRRLDAPLLLGCAWLGSLCVTCTHVVYLPRVQQSLSSCGWRWTGRGNRHGNYMKNAQLLDTLR